MKINEVKSENLDHLGIISAIVFNLKIVEEIDKKLPVTDKSNVTMGQRVLAMILNGLGFTNERLYLVPLFFENKPLERLIGPGIKAEHLNDDCLGRVLDAIAEYGTTRLFSELAFSIAVARGLIGKSAHLDTTSLSVCGDYPSTGISVLGFNAKPAKKPLAQAVQNTLENKPEDPTHPLITHGYSKDYRPDLKQIVLSLVTTGPAGIPVFMEALDGNSSDKTSFHNTIKKVTKFQKQIQDAPGFIWVADSALYTADKLLLNKKLTWITRVPATLADVKALTGMPVEFFEWEDIGNGYRMVSVHSNYGGIKQRWQLIFSQQAYKREIHTFERGLLNTEKKITRELWHLGNELFACEADARKALQELCEKWKYHCPYDIKIEQVLTFEGKGRPKKDQKPISTQYKIKASFSCNKESIAAARNSKGRFILASNQLNSKKLPDLEIFQEYKNQSQVERGFRFLKDPWFMVDSIFLKKPKRIEALMMIMTLCLMVYNIGEYELREKLKVEKESIPNQVGKPAKNPTLRWIFQLMQGISVIPAMLHDGVNLIPTIVTNLTELRQKIIGYFGSYATVIYGMGKAVTDS